jgi:hypothetical protein
MQYVHFRERETKFLIVVLKNQPFLKECGIPTAETTQTSPMINAIFEQIIRDAAEKDNLVWSSNVTYEPHEEAIADPSVTHSQLPAQLSDQGRSVPRLIVTQKSKREPEPTQKPAKQKHRRRRQRIHPESVDSQSTLCQQQRVPSAREPISHAVHLPVEAEHERSKSLVSTLDASEKKRLGREETVVTIKARGPKAEATTSKRRSDLSAAIDRGRKLQERLDNLTKLTSRKGRITRTRSITGESPVAQTKSKGANDGTTRQGSELPVRRNHGHRLSEREEPLDEQVKMQDSHEVRTHVTPSARNGNPVVLPHVRSRICHARRPSSVDGVHPPRSQLPTNEPVDTGQPPIPPEQILDPGAPSVCPAIEPGSSVRPTKSSRDPSNHDWGGRSNRYPEDLLISAPIDPECEIVKYSQAELQEFIELVRQPESENAQDVKPAKPDDLRPEEKLVSTTQQLGLIKQPRRRSCQDAQGDPVPSSQVQSRIRRAHRPSPLDGVHPPRCRSLATELMNAFQAPLPPNPTLDTCTRPVRPNIDVRSSVNPAKSSRDSSNNDRGGRSSRCIEDLLLIPAPFDPESEVAKSSHAALQESIEHWHMPQPESESAQDVKPTKPDDRRLEEELASTREQLGLVEQEILTLRRDLDHSREQVQRVRNHSRDLETECYAKLSEAEETRRVSESKFVQVVEQLRIRSAELESSRAEVEASRFKCSQITFLSAAQQERISELEAKVKTLRSTQNHSATTVARTVTSSFLPRHPGMGVRDLRSPLSSCQTLKLFHPMPICNVPIPSISPFHHLCPSCSIYHYRLRHHLGTAPFISANNLYQYRPFAPIPIRFSLKI